MQNYKESPYQGQEFAFLTKHKKEDVVRPIMEPGLGCQIRLVDEFDTDALGTFTRDKPRCGTQLEAARQKAKIGMEISGLSYGIAREGSFSPHPQVGILLWNVEMLIFIDDKRQLEIVGVGQGSTNSAHTLVSNWFALRKFAQQIGFPDHGIILRPDDSDHQLIHKDISSWSELQKTYATVLTRSMKGKCFVETDLRAHANPTRQKIIQAATIDLLTKLQSLCPACDVPGFSIVEKITGLPCCDCGFPTRDIVADIFQCARCGYKSRVERKDFTCADPYRCDHCNP